MNSDEKTRAEIIVREYLLRVADQVSMERIGSSGVSLFTSFPFKFRLNRFLAKLPPGTIQDQDDHQITFNINDTIKNFLNQTGLLFDGSGSIFYSLTDPKFSQHGNEIAYLISTDRILSLYISDTDKAQLSQQGVYLDSPEL